MTEERLSLASERLREIPQETAAPEPFRTYFQRTAEFLLSVTKDADPERFPADILPEHYETSFADPDYAARILGTEFWRSTESSTGRNFRTYPRSAGSSRPICRIICPIIWKSA